MDKRTSSEQLHDDGRMVSGDDPTDSWLSLADEPSLELADELAHVAELAQSLRGAQKPPRSLLRAIAAVSNDLRLPVVLRQIVEGARELAGAEYAALGVVGTSGELEQFIHVGMDTEVVNRIGALPRGKGVLGMLIGSPTPIRLNDLRAHPAASGFPGDHPKMESFLGVPVRVGDRVFGNLYLTESMTGAFTAEDEQLVVALAGIAGIAIKNARLYETSEKQRAWLEATAQVTQKLLAQQDESALDIVLGQALITSGADTANVVLCTPGMGWTVTASLCANPTSSESPVELETVLAGRAITSGKVVLVDDYDTAIGNESLQPNAIGAAVAVPLLAKDKEAFGALSLARLKGSAAFTEDDVRQVVGFANHVGIAIELDQARNDREAARLAEDRGRIAADLHDHVIQEIFAVGMNLQSIAGSITPSKTQSEVLESVEILDRTIKQIRSTIFQLQGPVPRPANLHHRLLEIVHEQSVSLGFEPAVKLSGTFQFVDQDQDSDLIDDVVAVAREALANVARHAEATQVTLEVSLDHTTVTVSVTDDGRGMKHKFPSGGLVNLRRRAEARAGHFDIVPVGGGGTRVVWSAQLHAASSAHHQG